MKKKLYQQPSIKVHEVLMDELLAASLGGSGMTSVNIEDIVIEDNPNGNGTSSSTPIINSKRGNLWGDDEE